jgi:hypothetical protein
VRVERAKRRSFNNWLSAKQQSPIKAGKKTMEIETENGERRIPKQQ